MHELSIAVSIVEMIEDNAEKEKVQVAEDENDFSQPM